MERAPDEAAALGRDEPVGRRRAPDSYQDLHHDDHAPRGGGEGRALCGAGRRRQQKGVGRGGRRGGARRAAFPARETGAAARGGRGFSKAAVRRSVGVCGSAARFAGRRRVAAGAFITSFREAHGHRPGRRRTGSNFSAEPRRAAASSRRRYRCCSCIIVGRFDLRVAQGARPRLRLRVRRRNQQAGERRLESAPRRNPDAHLLRAPPGSRRGGDALDRQARGRRINAGRARRALRRGGAKARQVASRVGPRGGAAARVCCQGGAGGKTPRAALSLRGGPARRCGRGRHAWQVLRRQPSRCGGAPRGRHRRRLQAAQVGLCPGHRHGKSAEEAEEVARRHGKASVQQRRLWRRRGRRAARAVRRGGAPGDGRAARAGGGPSALRRRSLSHEIASPRHV
mmetsp:Transcript_30834/g.106621  ORF Transcript_30834/g.106621 Transcript_30834/m.106621 type:complete len:398 (-) Transcript_30834:2207-3400(-)